MSMTGNNAKSEVVRGPERRRHWAAAEKIAIVAETARGGWRCGGFPGPTSGSTAMGLCGL